MEKKFEEYNIANGKWGWFHFYNPTNDSFAYKYMYHDDNIIIDNWWVWRYQELALEAIYGNSFADIKEESLLTDINNSISDIYNFVHSNETLKNSGISETDSFIMSFYLLAKDYKKIKGHIFSQQKIAGLFVLLIMDVIIRDCKYKFIENILFSAYRFQTILKIIFPDYDAENLSFVEFGKKKGEKTRQKIMADYKLLGDNFWEKETKYEGKINLLIKRYSIGETTAKKYYSKLLKKC